MSETGLIVLQITWFPPNGQDILRSATYGPWTVSDNEDYFDEVKQFLIAWRVVHGGYLNALLSIVQPPVFSELDGVH